MAGTPVSSCVRRPVPIAGLSPGPRGAWLLPHSHHVAGDEHVGNAREREQPLDERRPTGAFPVVEEKRAAGMHRPVTVNLHVSGSTSEVSAWIVIAGSVGRSNSDMFHDFSRVALTDGPQVFEGVDAGTVAVAPADGDGIVADALDHAWSYVGGTLFGSEAHARWPPRCRRHSGNPAEGPGHRKSRRGAHPARARHVRASRWRKPTEVVREPDGRTALSAQAGSPSPDSHVSTRMASVPWSEDPGVDPRVPWRSPGRPGLQPSSAYRGASDAPRPRR